MKIHRNARLGLAGRQELIKAIERSASQRQGARQLGVSVATAHKWWHRWQGASPQQRRTLECLQDHCSRPQRAPKEVPVSEQARICEVRNHTGWGPRRGRASALDRPPHPAARRLLAAAEARPGRDRPLRVALPGRSPAYGYQALRAH